MRCLFIFSANVTGEVEGLHLQSRRLAEVIGTRAVVEPVYLIPRRESADLLDVLPLPSALGRAGWLLTGLVLARGGRLFKGHRLLASRLLSGEIDVVHAEGLPACALLASLPTPLRERTIGNIIDPGSLRFRRAANLASSRFRRVIYWAASRLSLTLERFIVRRLAAVTLVSPDDARDVATGWPAPPRLLPLVPLAIPPPLAVKPRAVNPCVVIYANLNVPHQRAAALEAVDAVADLMAQANTPISLVGRVSGLGETPWRADLTVTYDQPEDLMAWLAGALAVVLPDRWGTGVKNRALDVGLAGATCVATPVALEGLSSQAKRSAFQYQTATRLRETIGEILNGAAPIDRRRIQYALAIREEFSEEATWAAWTEIVEAIPVLSHTDVGGEQ